MSRALLIAAATAALLTALPTAALAQAPAAQAAAAASYPTPAVDTRPLQYGRFTVEVVGKGPDVILIPGLNSSRETFRALVNAHKHQYRFHMIQVAGFAGTPAGDNASGEIVAPTVEAIDRYIRDRGLKAPAVIGHSLGGESALMLAARHPGDVGKIMAVDSLPFLSILFNPQATAENMRPMAEGMAKGMSASDDKGWLQGSVSNAAPLVTAEADKATVVGWSIASDRSVSARALRDLLVTDLRPELPRITAPATILYAHGPHIPATPEASRGYMEMLYKGLPGAKLVQVTNTRHFIMFDQPERFDREVMAFLGS
jgi:pimeloyl-[acyl-carrier protein] methyl ester esterase